MADAVNVYAVTLDGQTVSNVILAEPGEISKLGFKAYVDVTPGGSNPPQPDPGSPWPPAS